MWNTDTCSGEAMIIIKFGQKNVRHIYIGLHTKLHANSQKSKEIAQFIRVYIKNSEKFT